MYSYNELWLVFFLLPQSACPRFSPQTETVTVKARSLMCNWLKLDEESRHTCKGLLEYSQSTRLRGLKKTHPILQNVCTVTLSYHGLFFFRRTLGERSFQYIRPVIWNSLSFSVRHATSLFFQAKTENPPLLFCLLISRFLSSVSIKPMTTI